MVNAQIDKMRFGVVSREVIMGYNRLNSIGLNQDGIAMSQKQAIELVKKVKARHEKTLLKLANVVGVGVGIKEKHGQWTDQIALIINVSEKKDLADLSVEDIVPPVLDDVVTDVQEVGQIKAF